VKVVLSGLGGDELFLGYNAYRILHLCERLHRGAPHWLSTALGQVSAAAASRLAPLPWSETERAGRMLIGLGRWDRVYGLLRNLWDTPALRRKIYGPRLLDEALPDAFQVLAEGWAPRGATDRDPLQAMAHYEWRQKMVNDLLWQEDRASMAQGLEVRVPFVDTVFAGQVQSLSRTQLMPGGRPKGHLRDLLGGLLPREVLDRPKSGFQVDAPVFVEDRLGGLLDQWFTGPNADAGGLFNQGFVRQVRKTRGRINPRWHYFILYLMLGTRLWESVFIDRQTPEPWPAPRP